MKSPKHLFASDLMKAAKIFFLTVFSIFTIVGMCAAHSEDELDLLRMFYKEEDLFLSATHHPKSISQIAENITIVTAKEIEAMNAHSVAEVINRVPGLFVNFNQGIGTFGSASLLRMQGARERHTLVLVDGVPLNALNSGSAETNTIPVGIIERIEIIKGPASSAWGSALGGVIHIITKPEGVAATPSGKVQAAIGEMNTRDLNAQISGKTGRLGYYLFGGRQESDGPGGSRAFENRSLFSKFAYGVGEGVNFKLSLGLSDISVGQGEFDGFDLRSSGDIHNFWGTAQIDADLGKNILLSLQAFRLVQKINVTLKPLGLGRVGSLGDLYQENIFDETITGGKVQMVWKKLRHTTVLGVEVEHGELDQSIESGQWLQTNLGAPAQLRTTPTRDDIAIYLNTTIKLGRLSITPGIRYDNSSISDDFISPSLGLAYRLGKETLLRGSVARGFTAPPLSWTSGGSFFLDPNPSLENERAWSYQLGLESAALRYVWVRTALFRHDVEDIFTRQSIAGGPPSNNDLIVNSGSNRRQGIELEIETVPIWNWTLKTGLSYVRLDPANAAGETEIYTHNIGIAYDNPQIVRAEIFGHYVWWDAENPPDAGLDNFVWDLNLQKRMFYWGKKAVELFFTVHNIFGGDQFVVADNPNPDRWMEAGVRLKF